jgi:hypothetical protein
MLTDGWWAKPSPRRAVMPRKGHSAPPGADLVEAEMAKAPRSLERYFVVFEEGALRSKRLADLGDLAEVPQEVIEH